jgi:hypothetical protein
VAFALAAVAVLLWTAPGARAAGPTPITDCGNDAGLRAAVAAGGTYAFACSGSITLSSEIVVSKSVSIDASGQHVEISGFNHRLFDVTTGNLTLTGGTGLMTLGGGGVGAPGSPSGVAGTNGS